MAREDSRPSSVAVGVSKLRLGGSVPLVFACLLASCAAPVFAQEAGVFAPASPFSQASPATHAQGKTAPAAPRTPSNPPPARPSTSVNVPGARTPQALPPHAARPALLASAPQPPGRLVTVMHRLSGWKLLTWLALTGPPQLEIDDFPSASDVHTNIVAGFVSEDGRTVVARLPQAGAELESFVMPPMPAGLFPPQDTAWPETPDFTLVRGDGTRVQGKFVGLDAATGLSLLEAAEPLFPPVVFGDEGETDPPTVGQRVHLFAPARAPVPPARTQVESRGDEGVIYLSMGQAEGLLTEVKRTTSGKPLQATVLSKGASPAWTGAVATDESGSLLGIVARSGTGGTQLVPVDAMRGAAARVLARRASVPQPWLGVRGDAASTAPLPVWLEKGWSPETVAGFMKKAQGVLLTSVAPGTPAALAGLRPGDVISRVGEREVRGIEDLSLMLREGGVGSTLDFTVWRALEKSPLRLPVVLSGTQNPALATAEAEERAARTRMLSAETAKRAVETEERSLSPAVQVPHEKTRRAGMEARRRELEEDILRARAQVAEAEMRVAQARLSTARIAGGSITPLPLRDVSVSPLRSIGVEIIGLTPRSAPRLQAKGGVLVVSVRPESAAASSGLRAGDVIETIDGRLFVQADLRNKIRLSKDTPLSLGIVREGARLTLKLSAVAPASREK